MLKESHTLTVEPKGAHNKKEPTLNGSRQLDSHSLRVYTGLCSRFYGFGQMRRIFSNFLRLEIGYVWFYGSYPGLHCVGSNLRLVSLASLAEKCAVH